MGIPGKNRTAVLRQEREIMKAFLIGQTQALILKREADFGVYLGFSDEEGEILLPKKQVPENAKIGDILTVFIYKDSEDRLIATVNEPLVKAGEMARLTVKAVTRIGAFLDWGLEKDLFLPYKEMEGEVRVGDRIVVYVYPDKSKRLSASMKIYDRLKAVHHGEFLQDESFHGIVYRVNRDIGVFVAVEQGPDFYFGLIPKQQVFKTYRPGDDVTGRVVRVRDDGKLDLSAREKDYKQIDSDSEAILEKIIEFGGTLPFSDNASPEIIKRELGMSKNGFKKALGHLYKLGKIAIDENEVRLLR